jgi:hypothetical protein
MATQVRDHGVFTAPPPATIETATLSRDQLVAQKSELDARLAPLLDKIQAGAATPEEMTLVTELAEDSRILTDRLQRARVELTVAEEKQARQQAATKRDRFDDLVIESRRKRAKFFQLYRESCLLLGELCANVDEATQIANSFIGVAGMDPVDKNAVTEMSEDPNPLPALLDSGLTPTVGFGWNLRLSIIALQKKGETK